MSTSVPTGLEQLFQLQLQDAAGNGLPRRPTLQVLGSAPVDDPANNRTVVTLGGATSFGPDLAGDGTSQVVAQISGYAASPYGGGTLVALAPVHTILAATNGFRVESLVLETVITGATGGMVTLLTLAVGDGYAVDCSASVLALDATDAASISRCDFAFAASNKVGVITLLQGTNPANRRATGSGFQIGGGQVVTSGTNILVQVSGTGSARVSTIVQLQWRA